MSKVITVSRTFPSYHPKAGQPTYFVEQILNALGIDYHCDKYLNQLRNLNPDKNQHMLAEFFLTVGILNDTPSEKLHTIRAKTVKKTGEVVSRWKQGDKASLRVWSSKPYNSPQIIIAPDVELVAVGEFAVRNGYVLINNAKIANQVLFDRAEMIHKIAKNDGLSMYDMKA